MNLPNKLTVCRVILIPFFMLFVLLPDYCAVNRTVCDLIAAALFGAAALTDFFDGKIARSRGLVTDFGKFMDPIADKLMVIGAFLCFLSSEAYAAFRGIFVWVVFLVLLREFAVTSLRLVAQSAGGKVIAANMPGKIKTVSQIVFILSALLERHLFAFSDFFTEKMPITCTACAVMLVFTVYSGVNYFRSGAKYINPNR